MTHHATQFTKMHGLGNDFVIINALDRPFDVITLSIPQLANRRTGIGFDQLLIIESSKQADYFCRIFNSDGSEAEQCGNGLRCVARFISESGIDRRRKFRLETLAGTFPIEIIDYDHVQISMGIPQINEELIKLDLPDIGMIPVSILSLGNPHAIIKIESIDTIQPDKLASQISAHSRFPDGVNVGFMEVVNKNHIRLRTYERGAGETLACGSNACAAAVSGIVNGWLQHHVNVEFHYGILSVEWKDHHQPVHMTGPATKVYAGSIDL
ncbi:MAG: diaminopimelate epimerase [Gammaproteobacteria bacterium]|nr:diaminopimelate epimerase [Gammaproteobacteria bacterium]MCW5582644.1 diaminopimelate epimerase [Gammaproteobacteria bacterium]